MDFALFSFIGACLMFFVNVLVYRLERRRMDYVSLYPNVENESLICGKDEELGFYRRPDYVSFYDDMCVEILVFRFIARVLRVTIIATILVGVFLNFLPVYLALFFGYVCVVCYEDILAYLISLNLVDDADKKILGLLKIVMQTLFVLHVFTITIYVLSLVLFGNTWWSTIVEWLNIIPF